MSMSPAVISLLFYLSPAVYMSLLPPHRRGARGGTTHTAFIPFPARYYDCAGSPPGTPPFRSRAPKEIPPEGPHAIIQRGPLSATKREALSPGCRAG